MASPCEVHLAGAERATAERVLALVAGEAARIEAKYSRYRPGNVVHAINTAGGQPVEVDEETARLLDYAGQLFDLSGGRFDVTSGVLRKAWTFDGSDRLPARAAVEALLATVGWRKVQWRAPRLTLRAGMQIDFGGIGKEYAVDRAAALAAPEWSSCLINFGGDLLALGPGPEGRPWRVGVEALADPTRRREANRARARRARDERRCAPLSSEERQTLRTYPGSADGLARRGRAALGDRRGAFMHAGRDARDLRVAARRGRRSVLASAEGPLLVLAVTPRHSFVP